jgi:hypothetical protein
VSHIEGHDTREEFGGGIVNRQALPVSGCGAESRQVVIVWPARVFRAGHHIEVHSLERDIRLSSQFMHVIDDNEESYA